MTIAFTFPGQGSQSVGMGKDLADAFPEARRVFDEVDEALGEKLSTVIWEGPDEALTLTANAQPALMAVSLAALRALEARGFSLKDKVVYVAGHSLGEYSALAAAGTFSIADTARLLRTRGKAMQQAVPVGEGAMAAILGLEHEAVETACAEAAVGSVCQVANDNGGGQLVISGAKAAVELAAKMCTDKGAKRAIMLPVSAPFHSALMQPAAEAMRAALASVTIKAPAVPLVANVHASAVDDPTAIRDGLVQQVTATVRWRESVAYMASHGVDSFYEVGSGKVLTGLAKRIASGAQASALNTPDDIAAFKVPA